MPKMDLGFEFLFWATSVAMLVSYLGKWFSGGIKKLKFVDRIGYFFSFVLFPCGFIGSRLFGNEFFNSLPIIDVLAEIIEIIDNWTILIFLALGMAYPNQRKNYFGAALFGFLFLIFFHVLNNYMSVVLFVIDLTVGFSDGMRKEHGWLFGLSNRKEKQIREWNYCAKPGCDCNLPKVCTDPNCKCNRPKMCLNPNCTCTWQKGCAIKDCDCGLPKVYT